MTEKQWVPGLFLTAQTLMDWIVFAASCIAILAGMEISEMALVIVGLGGILIALVMMGKGKNQP